MAESYPESDYLFTRYLDSNGSTSAHSKAPHTRYDVAIIGLGRAGCIQMNNVLLTPRLRLRYLVDSNQARLQQLSQQHCLEDRVKLLSDTEVAAVFGDKGITAVIITTPTRQHEQYVTAALRAGKHVLCEKPLALTLDLVRSCYRLAKENKLILLCAFNRRYDPSFASIVAQVRAGKVGQVQCVSTVSRDSPRPGIEYLRTSGGIFHDCIVHDVDLICYTLGEYPQKAFAAVHCFSADISAINDVDTVVVTLKFPSGVLAHIDVSRHAVYGYDQRLEVHGSKGMLQCMHNRPTTVESFVPGATARVPIHYSFPSRYNEAYRRQMDHFLGLLDGTEELSVTEEDVVSVGKVIQAMEKSVETERFESVQY